MADQLLDAMGLLCPLPVLKARKRLAELKPGQLLEILTDDPGAPDDLGLLCQLKGHRMVSQESLEGGGWVIRIERAG
ncbi:MAG: sulfurtransferase TusA family protein [Pseudomonadota bacterium]